MLTKEENQHAETSAQARPGSGLWRFGVGEGILRVAKGKLDAVNEVLPTV